MKKTLIALAFALALTACGQKTEQPAADAAPAPAPAAQSGGDNGLLWGIGGFLLGQALAPKAPTVVQQPVYVDRPVPAPAPAKPPPVTTTPAVKPPAPTAAPRNTMRGTSGFSSYRPSRSFSSGGFRRR